MRLFSLVHGARRIGTLGAIGFALAAGAAAEVVYDTITGKTSNTVVLSWPNEIADDAYITAPAGWLITGADVIVGPPNEPTPKGTIRISIWSSKSAPGGPMPDLLLGQGAVDVPAKIGNRVVHVDLPSITVPSSSPVYVSFWTASTANYVCLVDGPPSIGQTTTRVAAGNSDGSWYMTTASQPMGLRLYAVPAPGVVGVMAGALGMVRRRR